MNHIVYVRALQQYISPPADLSYNVANHTYIAHWKATFIIAYNSPLFLTVSKFSDHKGLLKIKRKEMCTCFSYQGLNFTVLT